MEFEKYKNLLPYPSAPAKPVLDGQYPDAYRKYADALEKHEVAKNLYRKDREAYDEETAKLEAMFRGLGLWSLTWLFRSAYLRTQYGRTSEI